MRIANRLANCRTLDDLEKMARSALPMVERLTGSRRFTVSGDSGSLALKDLVSRLDQLFRDSIKTSHDLEKTLEIVKVIRELDWRANKDLSECWIGARVLHFIVSWLSWLRFDRATALRMVERQAGELRLGYSQKKSAALIRLKQKEENETHRIWQQLSLEQLMLESHAPLTQRQRPLDELADQDEQLEQRLAKERQKSILFVLRQSIFSENEDYKQKCRLNLVAAIKALSSKPELLKDLLEKLDAARSPYLSYIGWPDARHLKTPNYLQFLKELPWSAEDEQLRARIIPQALSYHLKPSNPDLFFSNQIDKTRNSSVVLDGAKFFMSDLIGEGDFRSSEQLLSPELVEAIAQSLEQLYQELLAKSTEDRHGLSVKEGLALIIRAGRSCQFHCSQLKPLFERLKQVPGLGCLVIDERERTDENYLSSSNLGEAGAQALLELLRANPFLREIRYNGDLLNRLGEQKLDELIAAKRPWSELFEDEKKQADLAQTGAQALLELSRTNSTAVQDLN